MKLARTIRFDPSDLNVFPRAADEGEWALVGTFCFAGLGETDIKGKVRQAFSNGFLGLDSMGFSTLVSIVTAKPGDIDKIENRLCEIFITEFGAPDKTAAMVAATEEIKFMADLCAEHKTGTLLALQRSLGDDGIRESFRSLPKPDSCAEQKIWTMVEDEDNEADADAKTVIGVVS
ncbi:MAG: hypothetical protein ISP43_03525 [Candidatus Puniceispirillum sp.]|nr:hypothetical protein [Candidatus Puniceispirillum sp.]